MCKPDFVIKRLKSILGDETLGLGSVSVSFRSCDHVIVLSVRSVGSDAVDVMASAFTASGAPVVSRSFVCRGRSSDCINAVLEALAQLFVSACKQSTSASTPI